MKRSSDFLEFFKSQDSQKQIKKNFQIFYNDSSR
jgi:hypothetical protein